VKSLLGLSFLLAVASSLCVLASPPKVKRQNNENAAVKILRADVSLRQSYPLAPDAAKMLETSLDSPLNSEDRKIVAAGGGALVEFEHAAHLQHCDWEMSFEEGALTNTSQRGAVTELVALAGLRARLRFHDGYNAGALKDMLAAMAGERDLSVDGSINSALIAFRLETELTEILSHNLPQLSRGQLAQLSRGLDELPPGSSMRQAFEAEKLRRNDFAPIAREAKTRDDLIDELLKRAPALESNRKLAAEIVDECGGSVAGFRACVRQQQLFYAAWDHRFSLPPAEFERMYQSQFEAASKSNPVIRIFTPALPRLRWLQAYCETRRAMLRAAIAVRLEGQSALKRLRDPYDANPFSYAPVNGGFELKSRLSDRGTPISLLIAPN